MRREKWVEREKEQLQTMTESGRKTNHLEPKGKQTQVEPDDRITAEERKQLRVKGRTPRHRREEERKTLIVKGRTAASPQRGGEEDPQSEGADAASPQRGGEEDPQSDGTDGRVTAERRRERTSE